MMERRSFQLTCSFRRSRCRAPFSRMSVMSRAMPEKPCETVVAIATPATPMPTTRTKNRFRMTLITPAII